MKQKTKGLMSRLITGAAAIASASNGKAPADLKKRVWRISTGAPAGEWVEVGAAPKAQPIKAPHFESSYEGWLSSSMDLLGGADIVEEPAAPQGGFTARDPEAGKR